MKIFHIAGGGDKGGAKTHIFALCKELSKNNDLTLLSMREGEFSQDAKAEGLKTKVFDGLFTGFDMIKLAFHIKKEKPDIVHCHGAKANISGLVAKMISPKIPFTTTVHSDYKLDYMHSFWKKHSFGFLNTIALRFFDYYVAVSDNFKKMLINRDFKADKILTIYNGLDFKEAVPNFDRKEYLNSLGLDFDGSQCVFGIATRLTPVKDIPTLLNAFAKSYQSNKNIRLLIGGDGDSTEMLKNMAKTLDIDKAVSFCGWISDVTKFYKACDVDVLCSVSESFPYSILEGIRSGCAVISSDVGGVTSMISSGENGYVFQPKDVETFSKYISDLAENKEKRRDFAKKLHERASSLYSIENMAKRQRAIYDDILTLKNRKGKKGVLICGAYGRGNSGDEAILQAIIDTMKKIDPLMPITVMTRKPKETAQLHYVRAIYTFNALEFIPAMIKHKLFISGGGSLIQNVTSTRSLLFYLYTIKLAKIFGCKVLMYGCGIGEVFGKIQRKLTKLSIDKSADIITVRDSQSLSELEDMGITTPTKILTADPAFCLEHSDKAALQNLFKSHNLDENGKYICFSVRNWKDFDGFEIYANVAKYAFEKHGLTAIFLPIEVPKDLEPTQKIIKHMSTPYVFLSNPCDVPLIMSFLGKMQVVCASRLHALVFAASAGVPFIATSYDIKVRSFMENIGKSEFCTELKNLDEAWLKNAIDNVLQEQNVDDYKKIKQNLTTLEGQNLSNAKKLLEK